MTEHYVSNIGRIAERLSSHSPEVLNPVDRGHAAVALVLRHVGTSPEVLFIIRAEHDKDPWSGNIGFPGGRLNREETPREAAERETREELSLNLAEANFMGRLNDLYGATLPVLVSCFIYHLEKNIELQPNHEVATTFWYPLSKLLEAPRHTHEHFSYRGKAQLHPVVKLLEPGQPLLWGITYRLLRNFFDICGVDFGTKELPQGEWM